MDTPWPTREFDLRTAQKVIDSFIQDSDHTLVGVEEAHLQLEGNFNISRADWVVALQETFEKQYGEKRGREVTDRVLTTLITDGEIAH